jgi:myo-inositol-1(or 4)-monophosphatase
LATSAAQLLVDGLGRTRLLVDTKSTVTDMVTDMDRASEQLIVDGIRRARPGDGLLGEEGTASEGDSGVRWLIDPIDGTKSFVRHYPFFSTQIALMRRGEIVLGVSSACVYGELAWAERGRGAFLNGRPIRVSAAEALVDAMLVTGFPYDVHARVDEIVGLFGAFVGEARAVRRLGSAALDLCYVAAGRMDGFWETDLNPWDIAGGALMVAEAGGLVSGMDGAPFASRGGHVLATNGRLHGAMLDVIRAFRGGRAPQRTH